MHNKATLMAAMPSMATQNGWEHLVPEKYSPQISWASPPKENVWGKNVKNIWKC